MSGRLRGIFALSGGVLDRLIPGDGILFGNAVIGQHNVRQGAVCGASLGQCGIALRDAAHAAGLPRSGFKSVAAGVVLDNVHGALLSAGLLPDRRGELLFSDLNIPLRTIKSCGRKQISRFAREL